jgi:hypothetical protein
VNRRGIGRHQSIKLAEAMGYGSADETGGEFAGEGVDIVDVADVVHRPSRPGLPNPAKLNR